LGRFRAHLYLHANEINVFCSILLWKNNILEN